MLRTERGESTLGALLSVPVLLAVLAMVGFYFSIAVPDKAALSAAAPVKANINTYEVIKDARKMKAWKLMEKRDLTKAVLEARKLLDANSNDVSNCYCAAVVFLSTGNKDMGFSNMKKALALAPQNKDLRLEFGRMLSEAGMTDEAITQYRMVINQAPKFMEPRMALAQIYLNKDQYSEAIKELDELIKLNPNDASALKIKGIALARAGKSQEGMDSYIAGTNAELSGGQPDAIKFIVGLWGNLDKAKYSLEQDMLKNPDDPMPKLRLAEISLYAGDPTTAKAYLIDARNLAPTNPEVQRSLCVALKRLGDNRQALIAFQQSITLEQEQNYKLRRQAQQQTQK